MNRSTRLLSYLASLLLVTGVLAAPAARAQSEPLLGEIRMFAGNFAPQGWALCDGQLLQISQNTALFSILGTTYGGNGVSTFALPDLRGRFPIGVGQGTGLTSRLLGEQGGEETVTLIEDEMPSHTHLAGGQSNTGNRPKPTGRVPAANVNAYSTLAPDTTLSPSFIQPAGGDQPHNNMPPYLGITFIIALQGIYPPR
jgi:microcystin-dependent protein